MGTTAARSAAAGDVWDTRVGFVSPLPAVAAGRYTATVTFTVDRSMSALRDSLLAALVLVPASAGAGTARPPLALTATPAHVAFTGSGQAAVRVTNQG